MNHNIIKNELQHLLQGTITISNSELIQTIANYLEGSFNTSKMAQRGEQNKSEEEAELINYINKHQLWYADIDFNSFISAGAEQRVFIQNNRKVLKLNDTIYYRCWIDYLHNLLLNNYFFPDTAYKLIGFYKSVENVLFAVVEQNFVIANQATNLSFVKDFLLANGFENTKNHDYYNPNLGIILEDLHDENVLTANDFLYFIDTVFYLKPEIFWA